MKVLTGDPGFWGPAPGSGTALTVGVFDGVHLGHQALLTELRGIAAAEGLETVVVTFDVHPKRFFDPDGGPTLLVSLSRRLELLEEAGVDQVGVLPFADIRTWGQEQFVRRVMVDGFVGRSVLLG
ncbi:MAG: adenylyltransferase/cytidyltransferase family protein [Acidimicrobiia bacterium]|nr:adenylyltransferase/cytidyltransferase family protein [Acidimicrobiia bacterium]